MSVQDKLQKLNDDLLSAYNKIEEMGGTLPNALNSNNLASAIATIPHEEPREYIEDKDQTYFDALTEDDIGKELYCKVNDQDHIVRLIGIDHDNLASGSGKAHTTWEFVNLLSDSTGHSIATIWDWENGFSSKNYDFPNSNIQKALNGTGTAPFAGWYQKGSATKSTTYTSSVLEMLPAGLQNVIKQVNKVVATTSSYTNTTYATKIFIPSYREMTATGTSEQQTNEGTTYAYYVAHDNDSWRQKAQIANTDTYTDHVRVTDGNYSADNYAGYCDSKYDGNCEYYLRSPYTTGSNCTWIIYNDGILTNGVVYLYVEPIAPCFCI